MKTAKDQVDKLVLGLKTGKDIHDLFADQVRSGILIQGKTLDQWKQHFTLDIPDSPTTAECKMLDTRLMELHQEATFLKSVADAAYTLGKKGYDTQYREKFTTLVSEYKLKDKKLPSKDTLEILASNDLDDIQTGLSYSEVATKFWKDILEDLNFKRRAIENITINNATEAKFK